MALVGIISDAHGNSIGLSAVLAELDRQRIEQVLFAGDVVGYYPYVNEVFDLLRSRDATCVMGNHDACLLGTLQVAEDQRRAYNIGYVDRVISPENRAWLATLPRRRAIRLRGIRGMLCHGSPWAIDEYVYSDHDRFQRFDGLGADVVVMGHTHTPLVRLVGSTTLINPGSCGQPRDNGSMAAYALLDIETRRVEIRRVPFDVDAVCERVIAEGFDPSLVTILRRRR
jgi:putative phosphoesterase